MKKVAKGGVTLLQRVLPVLAGAAGLMLATYSPTIHAAMCAGVP